MKRTLATLAILGIFAGGACSASGGVDTSGDGVEIRGDLDPEK